MRLIESNIRQLRDPFVVYEEGIYYVYGTNWCCYYGPSLVGPWSGPVRVVEFPGEHPSRGGCHWAPEVHRYNGAFYMFTTYRSAETGHRGCVILKADNPLGPFREIRTGFITPADWDSIDATFYVDEEGEPWMVFVHEWTCTEDGVGRMAAARLSRDLTHFVTEPVDLFRADDPSWARGVVTDGCFMYRTEKGSLLMLWSNWDEEGYCVGISRSRTGKVQGPWIHEEKLLYSKAMTGQYDGGHGMIFEAGDGKKYLSMHSPNEQNAGRPEMPVFMAVKEENDTLVAE